MPALEESSPLLPRFDTSVQHRASLHRSSRWSNPMIYSRSSDLLQGRLESVLVLELHIDGGRRFLNLSIRGLYKHVIATITHRMMFSRDVIDIESSQVQHGQEELERMRGVGGASGGSGLLLSGSLKDTMTSTFPLGHAMLSQTTSSKQMASSLTDQPTSFLDSQRVPPSSFNDKRPSALLFRNNSFWGVMPGNVGGATATAGKEAEVTYRERLGGYLHPRDMRRLVTPFSTSNEPDLIVRRHVILLNFDPLRAIILRDRLLVIAPDSADSILGHLETRVRGGNDEVEKSIFGVDASEHSRNKRFLAVPRPPPETIIGASPRQNYHYTDVAKSKKAKRENLLTKVSEHNVLTNDNSPLKRSLSKQASSELSDPDDKNDTGNRGGGSPDDTSNSDDDHYDDEHEWAEMQGREWINLPFELHCADAVLHVVGSILQEDTAEVQKAALIDIQRLLNEGGDMQDDPLTIIRDVKDAVGEMTSRVKSFVQSMNRILDDDEDMALMNLSRLLTHPERFIKPVPQPILDEESDEPELILEAHLQGAFSLLNSLNLLTGQINSASDFVDRKLDATRNRLLLVNIMVSIFSLAITSASLVGAIFGMNLTNHHEDDPHAFLFVTTATILGAFGLGFLAMVLLFYSGLMPRFGVNSPSLNND